MGDHLDPQAVAEHVAKSILARIGPTLATISAPEATATPEAARASLHSLVGTIIDVLLGSAEAERWARFIVREQLQPTAAFDVIYGFMEHAMSTALRIVTTILDTPEDEYLVHGFAMTPYVYREHYTDAEGNDAGYYVLSHMVSK